MADRCDELRAAAARGHLASSTLLRLVDGKQISEARAAELVPVCLKARDGHLPMLLRWALDELVDAPAVVALAPSELDEQPATEAADSLAE